MKRYDIEYINQTVQWMRFCISLSTNLQTTPRFETDKNDKQEFI